MSGASLEGDRSAMALIRIAFAVLAATAVLLLIVAGALSPIPTELALRSGCTDVVAVRARVDDRVHLVVRAGECTDGAGRPLTAGRSVERLAGAACQSLRVPVDAVTVEIARSAGGATSVTLSRAELRRQYGPGPPGVVLPVAEHGVGDLIWVLLPIGYVAAGLLAAGVAWPAHRRGVVLVWIRR